MLSKIPPRPYPGLPVNRPSNQTFMERFIARFRETLRELAK